MAFLGFEDTAVARLVCVNLALSRGEKGKTSVEEKEESLDHLVLPKSETSPLGEAQFVTLFTHKLLRHTNISRMVFYCK